MKKLLFIIALFSLFIINVHAETIIDDYKVEINLDNDGVYNVKESFNVISCEEDNIYTKEISDTSYDYNVNLDDYNYYGVRNGKRYIDFKLVSGNEYYIEYKVKNNNLRNGQDDIYQFYQIAKNYLDYESIIFKNFYVIINSSSKERLYLSNVSNYKLLEFSDDGGVITGYSDTETKTLDSFIIKHTVFKGVVINDNNNRNNDNSFLLDLSDTQSIIYYLCVPLVALIINLVIIISYHRHYKKDNNYDKNGIKIKKIVIFTLILTGLSYFISLNHRAIFDHNIGMIKNTLFIMAFYSIFYFGFIFTSAKYSPKVIVPVELFLVFHSSFFFWDSIIELSISLVIYYYIGFIINAINLHFVDSTLPFVFDRGTIDNNKEIRDLLIKYKDR